ncbi:MAG: glycosyltransferase family 2 protein, partial [Clostridium celatum]|nr:glycosyltransferase family 2 protein [Clostridium celatum]
AVCWSQVPEKFKDFKGQRRRWHIGLMTTLISHRYIFLNPKYGVVGVFSFIYFLVYELFSCVLDIVGLIIIILSYFAGILSIDFLITFFMIYCIYSIVISVVSIILEIYIFKHISSIWTIFKLILLSTVESFGYRQVCSWCRLSGIIGYKKRKYEWNKISRKKQNKVYS